MILPETYAATLMLMRAHVPNAKLTEADIRAIRKSPARHAALAQKFNVGEANIRAIREYRSWKHVT